MHEFLQGRPIITIPAAAHELKLSVPTITTAVSSLVEIGVVEELTGMRRNREFAYREYLKLLDQGTEPLPA